MELLNKIQRGIFELECLNSRRENIRITTSFLVQRLLECDIRDYINHPIVMENGHTHKIFGVEITFNHYSNDIVIYDETRACLDERFKVTLSVS